MGRRGGASRSKWARTDGSINVLFVPPAPAPLTPAAVLWLPPVRFSPRRLRRCVPGQEHSAWAPAAGSGCTCRGGRDGWGSRPSFGVVGTDTRRFQPARRWPGLFQVSAQFTLNVPGHFMGCLASTNRWSSAR